MKVAIYDAHDFEKPFLEKENNGKHELVYLDTYLNESTTILAKTCDAVAVFVNDTLSAPVLDSLKAQDISYIVTRSAGYNHIDVEHARILGMSVGHVPDYSPYAVAEHTIALILALNRKLIRAHHRIMDLNFSLNGLVGFDMHGKTVGIVGTGKIGTLVGRILHSFGCKILYSDKAVNPEIEESYQGRLVTVDELCAKSDIITLHVPLIDETRYLINKRRIALMKEGVMLINTSRGGLVDTKAVIKGLKNRKVGFLGIDVYEEEGGLFFEDHSEGILEDDVIARLMTFKNVLITSHQGFLTKNALENIASTTLRILDCYEQGIPSEFDLTQPVL